MSLGIALVSTARRLLDLALIALIAVVLAALVVARVVPAVTDSPSFVVTGGSMEPTIHLGSVVITERVAARDLRVGDIVSLQAGTQHAVFTHRITRLATEPDGSLWVQTKGDANASEDPSMVPASAVLGRVAATIPGLGYVVRMLSTPQGIALLISVGIVTLLGAWLLEDLEEVRREALAARDRLGAGVPADSLPGTGQAA